MIASTLVMFVFSNQISSRLRGGLPVIPLFAVLRKVETLSFLIFGDAQADEFVHDLENDECTHNGEHPGNQNADELVEQLAGVAFEQARGQDFAIRICKNWIDCAGGENSGEQSANG